MSSYIQQLNFLDFGALSGIVAENHFGLSLEYKQGIHYKNPLTSAKFDQTVSFPISNPHSTIFVIRTNSQIINQNIFAKLNSSLESWDQESVTISMDHSGVAKYYHILAMGY